ncbi:MAG: VOC family protein [Dermatophilaceae bacterium]
MASILNPYLNFAGNAREAMEFYQQVLGGELTVSTFGEYGGAGPSADGVMHANLTTPSGFTLMASDVPPGQEGSHHPGTNVRLSLGGDDESLREYWAQLSDGATIETPLEKQVWGDEYGALADRFGIHWMVNIGSASTE